MTDAQSTAVTATPLSGIVTFLLDRSYSMLKIKAATLEGFNGYLGGLQAEQDADIDFTLLTFDDVSIDRIHVAVPVRSVQMLTESTYVPRGGTPLIEAAVKTILAVEESLAKRSDKPRVVICIQTDGEENASGPDFTTEGLKILVEQKQAQGWEFNFLGSGIDVYAAAGQYGFKRDNTMSYDSASVGATKSAFRATAQNSASFASGRAASTAYSAHDRQVSGDAFWASAATGPTNLSEAKAKPKVKPAQSSSKGRNKVADIKL